MGTNIGGSNEAIYQEMVEDEVKGTQKVPVGQKAKSHSLVVIVKKASAEIPAHIIDEAISTIRDIGFIWSGPITPKEMEYVEQYELAKYPEYANLIEGDGSGLDMSSFITDEPSELPISDDKRKSSRSPCFGSNLPDLDSTQLEPSTLLDILNKKSSFPGSFISIPEVHARNKVLKQFGLPDDEYLVLFTPSYKDAMMLVGESYPFVKGNYYMTILGEKEDHIEEFAFYKDSKVIKAPNTWLDLRIRGSQLSQNFRRRCKISPKGLFAYEADVNGTMHWVSEAHSFNWHVLLDASSLIMGKDKLQVGLHRPDFLVCCPDDIVSNPSRRITCLLVKKKCFDLQSFIRG